MAEPRVLESERHGVSLTLVTGAGGISRTGGCARTLPAAPQGAAALAATSLPLLIASISLLATSTSLLAASASLLAILDDLLRVRVMEATSRGVGLGCAGALLTLGGRS